MIRVRFFSEMNKPIKILGLDLYSFGLVNVVLLLAIILPSLFTFNVIISYSIYIFVLIPVFIILRRKSRKDPEFLRAFYFNAMKFGLKRLFRKRIKYVQW